MPTERKAMATAKTTTVTFLIEPSLKEAPRTGAALVHRFHRQHDGGVDSELLRAERNCDPKTGSAV